MKRLQIHSPDTCGCSVEVEWDDEDVQAPHRLNRLITKCREHTHPSLETDDKVYQIMLNENRIKNRVYGHLLMVGEEHEGSILPLSMINSKSVYMPLTQTKRTVFTLHDEVIFNYYFTGNDINNRQIVFSLEGIDKNGDVIKFNNVQKASIQAHLASKGINHQMVDHLHETLHPEYKASLDNRNTNKKESERL